MPLAAALPFADPSTQAVLMAALYLHVFFAVTMQSIAQKTSADHAWMAWLPVLNLFLVLHIAGRGFLWFLLLLIPGVNLLALVVLWGDLAAALGKSAWLGLLAPVPIANVVMQGYLAFSE